MDVTFLESETFFPKQDTYSSLQGELPSKQQNWENQLGFNNMNMESNQKDDTDDTTRNDEA